ncbi:hypothetical protein [Kocuria arenosa]|uniref:hypothetical protein n=1 Tax=Kocuria arenosa TaxID=3071446 RepID=UPI0034D41A33
MNISTTGALAIEFHPHSPTQWIATYYPMVDTPAGRWADVTWVLHQRLIAVTADSRQPARWLDARSADPRDSCYTSHQTWREPLAAGYAAGMAVYEAEAIESPLSPQAAQHIRDSAVVVPAGQLAEWVLDDLQDETSSVRG